MNRFDIEELQSFLINESSKIHKKADKIIENHNSDVNKNNNSMNLRKVGKIIKQKFFKKVPVELSTHTYFYEVHIDKSECKTYDEKYVWDYLYNILLKLPKKFLEREDTEKYDDPSVYKIKNILCKLVDLNPKKFGVTFRKINQENIIFEYAELISNSIRILRNDINKYIYLHFTHAKNLKMIDISKGSSHYNGTYSKPSIFFYAVKKSGNINARINVLLKNINRSFDYGDQVYQYIPKLSDEIYLDPTDLGKNGVAESLNNSGYAPVIILTNHALPVKKYDIQHMSDKIVSYYVNKDYDESWKSEDINIFIRNEAYKCKCDVCDVLQSYFNEKDANSVKSSPKKRFKQLLSEKVNEHMKNVDNMLEQKNIGIAERRKFKAYYVKQCKIEIEREFSDWGDPSQGYTNTTKRLILSYIHEYFEESNINEIIVDFYIDETIERFDAFMEEFNLTHNEDIHNE